jgi:UDP:flavonoid glycosyltransferase YjiC (YdhE family)
LYAKVLKLKKFGIDIGNSNLPVHRGILMKIILATCGSRGDVQPMLTLCLALKDAGHDPLLIGPPEKAMWAGELGCPYFGFGRDVTAFINTFDNVVNLSAGFSFISFVRQELNAQFKILPAVIKNADLVIGSSLMFALSSISQAANIRYRYIVFSPQLFPSCHHPFPIFKTQTLPKWLNKLSWTTARIVDRVNITCLLNRHRKNIGLEPIDDALDHILGENPIAACDKEILSIPEDVQKTVTQTGFLHPVLARPDRPDLDAFLESGSRPVYAGFGSMPPKDQKKNIPLLIGAARQAGVRIIILKFWEDSQITDFPEDVFFINAYPHLELFPKMAAVIHHGGAGTTAAAAVSGVPQIIVPHILDQYFHGQQIYQSHLGPMPIWRSRLTQKRLTLALKECLLNPRIQQNARTTGQKIDPAAALRSIVRAIEH